MATDQLRTHGSGDIAIRVDIEGRETQLVSDPAMVDPKVVWGRTGWSASDYYSGSILPGGSVLSRSIAFEYDGTNSISLAQKDDATDGWQIYISSGGGVVARLRSGGTAYQRGTAALTAGSVYLFSFSFDGSTLRVVLDQTTHATLAASFSASSVDATLGSDNGGANPTGCTIIGFAASDSIALSDAEMQAHHTECRRRGHMARFEKVEHLYRAPDLATDLVGSADWTVTGAPSRTTAEITTATDGRKRVYCINLDRNELAIDERVNIPEAKLESQGTTLRLFETDDQELAAEFWKSPTDELYVAAGADVETGDTTITLLSAGNVEAGDVVHFGTEAVKVGGVSGSDLTGLTRAYWNTNAQKHWTAGGDSDRVAHALCTDRPLRTRGRRVRIYTYDDGDDLQGDGRQGWLGKVTSEPKWRDAGGTMLLQIGPITKMMDQKIGGELEQPMRLRGIYYPWSAPIYVQLGENTGSGLTHQPDRFTGFDETQSSFVGALTTWLQHADRPWSGFNSAFRAIVLDDGTWTIECVVGSSVTAISISVKSLQDGVAVGETTGAADQLLRDAAGDYATTPLSSGDVVYPVWVGGPPGGRLVPRGVYGVPDSPLGRVSADRSTYPERRLYLSDPVDTDWTTVAIEWPSAGDRSHRLSGTGTSTSDNYVTPLRSPGGIVAEVYTPRLMPQVRPTKTIAVGSLADARDALVTLGPELMNLGVMPDITSTDLADWTSVVNAATDGRGWLANRFYTLAAPVELAKWLEMECRLLGVYPTTDSSGKIALQRIELPTSADPDLTDISEFIIEDGWPTADIGNQTTNRYILKTGFDPIEEEWTGTPYDFPQVDSKSQDHEDRPLEVTPYSHAAAGDAGITFYDAETAAIPVLTMYAYPYKLVTMRVSWKLFDLLLGDPVRIDAKHLPDASTGARPMSDALGIVVGRRWVFGEPHGELTIHVSGQNVAGYSPTAQVASQVNDTGDTWTLTITTGLYADGGTDEVDHFTVDDKVRIVEYDSESPTTVTGTVTATVTGTDKIVVDFDSTWTPGASTWELVYDDTAAATDGQKVYCAIAGDDARLDGGNARTYAP